MAEKTKFSTREWWFVIIIISFVQAAIWYVSFIHSGSKSALNYVSFAGTLVSIILAVLAIGYTYGESLSQKDKSDNISNQIAVLNEVIKNINIESKSLSDISKISNELTILAQKFESGFSETKYEVSNVSKSLSALLNEYEKHGNIKNITPSILDKKEAARSFMSARSPLMEICILPFILASGKPYGHTYNLVQNFLIKYINEARENDDKKSPRNKNIEELFSGSLLALLSALEGLGLITEDKDGVIHVAQELIEEIKVTTIANPISSGTFYASIRELLVRDVLKEIENGNE